MFENIFGRVRNSAVASQPCPSGHITADKRLRYASPKLPSATSFIPDVRQNAHFGANMKVK